MFLLRLLLGLCRRLRRHASRAPRSDAEPPRFCDRGRPIALLDFVGAAPGRKPLRDFRGADEAARFAALPPIERNAGQHIDWDRDWDQLGRELS